MKKSTSPLAGEVGAGLPAMWGDDAKRQRGQRRGQVTSPLAGEVGAQRRVGGPPP